MVEVLLVYGSLVLFNWGLGHGAAQLESQRDIEIKPFDDYEYEVLIESPQLSSNQENSEWIAKKD